MPAAASPRPIDVCICTYRRPAVRRALDSLAAQEGAPPFRVIVADNDDTPSAEPIIAAARAELGLDIAYVHAPARNISIARNACIDAAGADLIAFIDDDEIAAPRWLATLARAQSVSGADVVFGPVLAQYPPDAPAWAVAGDFHSVRPAIRAGGVIDTGYAGNVLIRRAAIAAERFDPAFGGGGEDTMFFSRLHAGGARMAYCPDAIAHEPTPPERANMAWLTRRAFRSGQTHAAMLRAGGKSAFAIAAPALAKALFCAGGALAFFWSPARTRAWRLRGALHWGVVSRAFSPSAEGAAQPA